MRLEAVRTMERVYIFMWVSQLEKKMMVYTRTWAEKV